MLLSRFLQVAVLGALIVLPAVGQEKDKAKEKDKAAKDKAVPPKAAPEKAAPEKAAPVKASADKVLLQWKFEKDKSFYQKMTTLTKQSMKVMNNDVNQTQDQTFYFVWTPLKKEGDNWIIQQKIEGVVMNIDIGGNKVSYDSTKPPPGNNPLSDFFKALVDAKFELTLDKDLKVTKIGGREEFVKKLTTANPQMKPLLDQILSEKSLTEMADPTFQAIPGKEVEKGKPWVKETVLDMGPIGKYENKYTYTYEGKDDKKLDKIKVETALTYKEPTEASGSGGLPFRIKKANLKSTGGAGLILFNPEKGRVEKSNMNLDLKGDLNIEIGGQATKVDLSQTQTTTVEATDASQLPKVAPPPTKPEPPAK